jgi:hypothetical protein
MDEERAPSLWERVSRGLGFCLLAVLLYVASIGPVILLLPDMSREVEPYPVLTKIYQPLVWVAVNTWAGRPIMAYADWWQAMRRRTLTGAGW